MTRTAKAKKPKGLTKAQRFEKLTMRAPIRAVMPLAREMVLVGIDAVKTLSDNDIDIESGICGVAADEILGFKDSDYQPATDERCQNAWLVHEAAFALGVAIGLQMRAETFEPGGAR